jgi:hypothetical protein
MRDKFNDTEKLEPAADTLEELLQQESSKDPFPYLNA